MPHFISTRRENPVDPTKIISIGSQALPIAKTAIENLGNATDAFARELLGLGNPQSHPNTSASATEKTPTTFQSQHQDAVEKIRGLLQFHGIRPGTEIDLKVTENGQVEVLAPHALAEQIEQLINSNDDLVNQLDKLNQKRQEFLWQHPGSRTHQSPLSRNFSQNGLRIPVSI